VACAGAAKPLLQPILDRLVITREGRLDPCIGAEEAVEKLAAAFRATAERDITVGDELEVVLLQPAGEAAAAGAVRRRKDGVRLRRYRFQLRAD